MAHGSGIIQGTIRSSVGFYIGDICYFMNRSLYHGVWIDQLDFGDGVFEDVGGTGYGFAVASTAYGDGSYRGTDGTNFGVDAGVLGAVPMELAQAFGGPREDWDEDCTEAVYVRVRGPSELLFSYEDGRFAFIVQQGGRELFRTFVETNMDDDEEDDYEEDGEDW